MRSHVTALAATVLLLACEVAHGAANDRIDRMSYPQLAKAADRAVQNGAIRSYRYGDASPYLKRICYEMVERAFSRFGQYAVDWALYVVGRESDCNPGAENHKYSSWSQQAQGIAQMIPAYHTWVNYTRLKRDLRYAVAVFVRLSRGGSSRRPWGG